MTTTQLRQEQTWHQTFGASIMSVWANLTDAPSGITEPGLRQRVRLFSILCVSIVVLGNLFYLISHYVGGLPIDPTYDIIFGGVAAGNVAAVIGYFLGRTRRFYVVGAALLIGGIFAATIISIATDSRDYDTLIMILVVASLVASLLMSTLGTLIILVLALVCTSLVPVFVPGIPFDLALNATTTIGLISLLIVVSNTVRQHDLRTIEEQARQLEEAKREAESANKLKSVFLGMISHELRTPLNNIMGYSDQILMGVTGEMPAATITAAERIHRNGENLSRMINDLLMLSRLEGGRMAIIQRPFRPADVMAQVNQSFRSQAEDKGITFTTTLDPDLPEQLVGDRQRVEQIVLNLASNAIKFTERGEIDIAIFKTSPTEWGARIRDTGAGIPVQAVEQIFQRFYQVDSTSKRAHGGAGLGLAIARELALLMGGNIVVETALNTGSTFTVTLPLVTDDGG